MEFLIDGPPEARATYAFAHGAGSAMDNPFMNKVARGIAERGTRVVRFEFPYMAARRKGGKRGAPDRQPVLLECWRQVVRELGDVDRLFIGGKSLGGRIATMVADEMGVRGVVCFGYPFHPPGRPDRLRVAHLKTLTTPLLILQGTRDPFGAADEVAAYGLSPQVRIEWIAGGDHSLKPPARSPVSERENVDRAVELAVIFITSFSDHGR